MSSNFVYLSFVFIGLMLASSVSQLFFVSFSKKPLIHLLMVFLGIFASLYLYNSTLLHAASDILEAGKMIKGNVTFYLLEMLVLIWILYLYNGKKLKTLFYITLSVVSVSLIINLILPQGIIFEEITGVNIVSFSWIDSYTTVHGKTFWFYEYLTILFYGTSLAFMILSFLKLKKEKKYNKTIVFSLLTILFLGVGIYDVLIDLEIIKSVYLTELFMAPVMLLLNYDIVYELRSKRIIESKFEKAERDFNTLVENVQLLVIGLTPDGFINYVNPYFQKITQYNMDELIGKDFMKMFIPAEQNEELENVFNGLKQGQDFFSYENPILRKDQQNLFIAWSNVLIHSSDNEIEEILCIGANITERINNRSELEIAYNEIKSIKIKLEDENTFLRQSLHTPLNDKSLMIGQSDAMKYVHHCISEIAESNTTVLIEGETGVGKELVAQGIQKQSKRKEKPFVSVNCAALPRDLIESELFGHEKGAFTGAISQRKGRFELADGGTLFLDEVGELPLDLQSKLLRVLQEGEIERLGGQSTIKVDVRIIAATNKNLKKSVNNGSFRDDLYYRLSVYPLTVPPLSKRIDDIPELVSFFVHEFCENAGRDDLIVSMATIKNLKNYSWPGNIRELRNVLERAVITSTGKKLVVKDSLEEEVPRSKDLLSMQDVEKNHILSVLDETHWKISGKDGAASILVMNEATLRSRMKKLGIERK